MKKTEPKVSFLIPTFNADKYIDQCLAAISDLKYPSEKIEVIVADGGSSDNTVAIANKYGARVVRNPKRIAEYGKKKAFQASSGDIVVFLDADNIIASRDWLARLLQPFERKEVNGVESNYLIAKDYTSLNSYANLLVIVDPLARMLASKPFSIQRNDNYLIKRYKKGSVPVSGANGFLWRRDILESYQGKEQLNEVSLLNDLAKKQIVYIGNVPKVGIYHYYCDGLKDYVSKRYKIANKHMNRGISSKTWVDKRGKWRLALSALYLVTIVGPALEATYQFMRTGRASWLWHPFISIATVLIYTSIYFQRSLLSETSEG